jgi:hypothetical protein
MQGAVAFAAVTRTHVGVHARTRACLNLTLCRTGRTGACTQKSACAKQRRARSHMRAATDRPSIHPSTQPCAHVHACTRTHMHGQNPTGHTCTGARAHTCGLDLDFGKHRGKLADKLCEAGVGLLRHLVRALPCRASYSRTVYWNCCTLLLLRKLLLLPVTRTRARNHCASSDRRLCVRMPPGP